MILIRGILKAVSPFMIGSGTDDNSDADVLKDAKGRPYIPGTTIAGVLRSYFKKCKIDEELIKSAFGHHDRKSNEDIESSLVFYDAKLEGSVRTQIRDSVRLNKKVAVDKGKFDYEVVDEGAEFIFRLMFNNENIENDKLFIAIILQAWKDGDVRIGAKTTRGFGEFRLEKEKLKSLSLDLMTEEGMDRYLNLSPDWSEVTNGVKEYLEYDTSKFVKEAYTRIDKELFLKSTLFIRNYSSMARVDLDDKDSKFVDAESLRNANGDYIIPGTTWAGVFRQHAKRILLKIGKTEEEAAGLINDLFGYETKLEDGKLAPSSKDKGLISKSKILFSESKIPKEAVGVMNRTRCSVDRFTGSALEGALFTDRILCAKSKQETAIKLEIRIAKKLIHDQLSDDTFAISLINTCIKDMNEGLLSVGGNTAIGAGLFSVKEEGLC